MKKILSNIIDSAFSSRENLSIIISSPEAQELKNRLSVELGSSHGTVLAIQKSSYQRLSISIPLRRALTRISYGTILSSISDLIN